MRNLTRLLEHGHFKPNITLEDWNVELSGTLLPYTVLLGVYCTIGVMGNTPIIFVYLFRMKRNVEDRFFIPFLAFFDLLTTIFMTTDNLLMKVFPVMFTSNALCKTLKFLNRVFAASSDCLLLVIAVHRYRKICKPFGARVNTQQKRLSVLLVFLFAVIVNMPVFIFRGVHKVTNTALALEGYKCDHVHDNSVIEMWMYVYDVTVLLFLVAAIALLSVLYVLIAKSIYRSSAVKAKVERQYPSQCNSSQTERRITKCKTSDQNNDLLDAKCTESDGHAKTYRLPSGQSSTHERPMTSPLQRRRTLPVLKVHFTSNRYTYMFMLLTVLFIVSYTPSNVLKIVEIRWPGICSHLDHKNCRIYLFFSQFHFLNHIVNPFIYSMFDRTLRVELRQVFCGRK